MSNRFRHQTIKPAQGGALIEVASLDNVGAENYRVKMNMRREFDREVRREGWGYFQYGTTPTTMIGTKQVPISALRSNTSWSYTTAWGGYFNGQFVKIMVPPPADAVAQVIAPTAPQIRTPITAVTQCVRANGDRLLVAATAETVYKFDPATKTWAVIGSGYSTSGKRWEVVSVNGETVFNNGVDLPFTVSVQYPTCRPIHELRERGVARVGTIAEYYGFLHCFDITEIKPAELNAWMNGATPYGVVPDGICNRIRQRHIWSEHGQPRNWAPVFTATLAAVTSTIQLPFPSSVFVANETRIAVDGGGINGGTLGGETGYESGILVTAVAGAQISLEKETAAGLTYPRTVRVMRFADTSSIVGYNDMTDDGSAIIKALALRDVFVVYRDTGIFVGRYTAVLEQPFLFKRVYNGLNVPYYPDTVIEVQGVGHLYCGQKRFFLFDGIDEPKIFQTLDLARKSFLFYASADRYSAFALQQPETREVWFGTPSYTLCYDYESKTASAINTGITAAAQITMPETGEQRLLLANVESDVSYGVLTSVYSPSRQMTFSYLHRFQEKFSSLGLYGGGMFTRYPWNDGMNPEQYDSVLVSGLWSLGDDFNEKTIRSYVLQLASGSAASGWAIKVKLTARHEANEEGRTLFERTVTPPDFTNGRLMLPIYFNGTFFQDEIMISGTTDVQIVARTIEVAGVPSRGIEKTRQ